MAVDVGMHLARPGKRDAVLDWLQMLTGAGLVAFMWCHMILVSSVVLSPKIMNAIAHFFEATYMAQVGGPLIFLAFLLHFALAARKIPFRAEGQATILQHAQMLKHRDTWLWVVQAVTAMVILVMGAIHMWVVLNDLPITAAKSAARVGEGGWTLFYLVLLPCVELHVSVGFYRIGVKWGFIRTENRKQAKKLESILFATFMVIGILTLIRFITLS
ncbi:succinate dehydrogenase/fumarate reductase cytochrome b subunit [Maridesulfovibrio sp.]|uniref:succinate dehydrogenase/fumarate reductase cytochrome b subunit n=1 Tax=Maridesulfovibrio sp. TaxID=2795000 RepID=UPI0029F593C4|nr:succinate dehydrogenase/fumarate reductase cytochrome b subunit [Maridesulfovibrio sp.]